MKPARIALLSLAMPLLLNFGCGSSDDGPADTGTGPEGGEVSGPTDTHCGSSKVQADPATCSGDTSATGGAADTAAEASAGGAADCTQTHDAEYGDTLYDSSGDDDDCKYQVSWTSTPIRKNADVTFTVTTTDLVTQTALAPLADGKVPLSRLDVYEPCQPNRRGPTQNYQPTITQTAPGVFTAGPIKFDESGRWVVRFHFYEQCVDGPVSPHGHVAFFVDVP